MNEVREMYLRRFNEMLPWIMKTLQSERELLDINQKIDSPKYRIKGKEVLQIVKRKDELETKIEAEAYWYAGLAASMAKIRGFSLKLKKEEIREEFLDAYIYFLYVSKLIGPGMKVGELFYDEKDFTEMLARRNFFRYEGAIKRILVSEVFYLYTNIALKELINFEY